MHVRSTHGLISHFHFSIYLTCGSFHCIVERLGNRRHKLTFCNHERTNGATDALGRVCGAPPYP